MSLLIDLSDLGVKLKLDTGELSVTVPNPDRKDEYKLTGNLKIGKVVTSGLSVTGMSVQELTLSDLRFDEKNIADLVLAYTGRELTLKSCVYCNNTRGRGDGLPPHNPAIFNHETLQKLLILDCDLQEIVIGEHSGITRIDVINEKPETIVQHNKMVTNFRHITGIKLCKTLDVLLLDGAQVTGYDARPLPLNREAGEFPVDHMLVANSILQDVRTHANRHGRSIPVKNPCICANKFVFVNQCKTSKSEHRSNDQYNAYQATLSATAGIVLCTYIQHVNMPGCDVEHGERNQYNGFIVPRVPNGNDRYREDPVYYFTWCKKLVCGLQYDNTNDKSWIPVAIRMIGLTPEVAEIVNRLSA